nr:YggS family pyridoxal phosphate-dependent enzyme [uncultured Eubacterium sp.]
MINENISKVRENIVKACEKAGRNPEEVTLIAVSKTKPVSAIEEALLSGTLDYGENKVQELCDKYDVLPKNIRWHMIGHLQRNKVKYLVGKTYLVHSVDSLRLAEQIEKEFAKYNQVCDILVEVNIAQEESKFGISAKETEELIRKIAKFEHVRIKGLMTIAPYTEDPESNRDYFREIKKLSVDIRDKNIDNVSMDVLSMGMTGDYMVAVEEGATMVRVGTGIFGERNYNI